MVPSNPFGLSARLSLRDQNGNEVVARILQNKSS